MIFKIDIRHILVAHFRTLANLTTKRPDLSDWISFVLIPLGLATTLVATGIYLDGDALSTVVSVFSIFVGLLLNVIVLLFDIVRQTQQQKLKQRIVKETLANVSFAVLLALASILIAFLTQLHRWPLLRIGAHFLTYALSGLFVATLLMIMKRIYGLFEEELREQTDGEERPPKEWNELEVLNPPQPEKDQR